MYDETKAWHCVHLLSHFPELTIEVDVTGTGRGPWRVLDHPYVSVEFKRLIEDAIESGKSRFARYGNRYRIVKS